MAERKGNVVIWGMVGRRLVTWGYGVGNYFKFANGMVRPKYYADGRVEGLYRVDEDLGAKYAAVGRAEELYRVDADVGGKYTVVGGVVTGNV